jgi:hypothetical protein
MATWGDMTFRGKSQVDYLFTASSLDTQFAEVGAVYFITRRFVNEHGEALYEGIYVGHTANLAEFNTRNRVHSLCEKLGANCICVHREDSEDDRVAIEADLIAEYIPPCNRRSQ